MQQILIKIVNIWHWGFFPLNGQLPIDAPLGVMNAKKLSDHWTMYAVQENCVKSFSYCKIMVVWFRLRSVDVVGLHIWILLYNILYDTNAISIKENNLRGCQWEINVLHLYICFSWLQLPWVNHFHLLIFFNKSVQIVFTSCRLVITYIA